MEEPELPFVDVHSIRITAPREVVWEGLESYVHKSLHQAERHPLTWLLGTQPRAGFRTQERTPPTLLALAGRHRFSTYLLVFELVDITEGTTELRATTYAAFPGFRGRVYRALVIGTRGHVLGVRHMLNSVEGTARGVNGKPSDPG